MTARRRWLFRCANVVALLGVGVHVEYTLRGLASLTNYPTDFTNYYLAAKLLLAHGDFYGPLTEAGEQAGIYGVWLPYTLTPLFAALFTPLTLLSHAAAKWTWNGLQVIWLTIALWLVVDTLGVRWPRRHFGIFLFLVALFPPLRDELNEGQVGIFLFLLVCVTWRLERGRRDRWAGALLGTATAIKLFPAVLLGYYLVKRRSRLVASAAVVALAETLVMIAVTGFEPLIRYATVVLPDSRIWYGHYNNQSLPSLFFRLFAPNPYTIPLTEAPLLAAALSLVAGALLAALTIWVWRRPHPIALGADLEFSLGIIAMLLVSPITWSHYLVFAYLPLLALVAVLEREPVFRPRLFDGILLVYLLLSVPSALLVDPASLDLPLLGPLAQALSGYQYEGERVGGLALLLTFGKVSGLLLLYGLLWRRLRCREAPARDRRGTDDGRRSSPSSLAGTVDGMVGPLSRAAVSGPPSVQTGPDHAVERAALIEENPNRIL